MKVAIFAKVYHHVTHKIHPNCGVHSVKIDLPNINHETVVFTKHAKDRLDLRRLGEDMVIDVMRKPHMTHQLDDGKIKFIGKTMGAKVHAICKPIPEENKWLVISLWVRGEDDAGNFVNPRKYRGGKQDDLSKLFSILIFLLIIIVAMVYYFTQM
jgi:hypothetical protein